MTLYENNYCRLNRLFPALASLQSHAVVTLDCRGRLKAEVIEDHKYTTVIKLTQVLPIAMPAIAEPSMIVRVYHDAQVAEVVSYQYQYRFKPKYDYPNPKMLQVREKQRVNEFLGEWLDYCLTEILPVSTVIL